MESGYFKIGRFGGAPIRLHWTAPLGAFAFNGFSFVPGAWAAFVLLILVHELGHAFFVRRFGMHLLSVDVHGLGGLCQYAGGTSPLRRAIIAWGGIIGQSFLLVAGVLLMIFLPVHNVYLAQAIRCLVYTNLYMMAFNLMPIPGFDGAEAWKIAGEDGLRGWWRDRQRRKKRAETKGVVRNMPPPKRRFISNDIHEDILENTPTSAKRPPKDMLN